MRKFPLAVALTLSLAGLVLPARAVDMPKLPSLREQDRIRQEWLKLRLARVLPTLMRRYGVGLLPVAIAKAP